jgi:hypothetical protein
MSVSISHASNRACILTVSRTMIDEHASMRVKNGAPLFRFRLGLGLGLTKS